MQQYFSDNKNYVNDGFVLTDNDYHHLFNVMRFKTNDKIIVVNRDNQKKYICLVTEKSKHVLIEEELVVNNELRNDIVLAFALTKSDKFELVLQKASELGVSKIVPLLTSRSIVKYDEKKYEKKMIRFKKIIQEACEQSYRNKVMDIVMPIKINSLKDHYTDLNMIAYEKELDEKKISDLYDNQKSVMIIIGPEGGFEQSEVDLLVSQGVEIVSLGHRILRCETAAIFGCSILSNLID